MRMIYSIHISQEEISKSINSLKNNKAAGYDKILNECIKNTKEVMLPLYQSYFNLILNTGEVPTQ